MKFLSERRAERIERILSLNRAGLTSSQIGARLGISSGAVRVALHKARLAMSVSLVKAKLDTLTQP